MRTMDSKQEKVRNRNGEEQVPPSPRNISSPSLPKDTPQGTSQALSGQSKITMPSSPKGREARWRERWEKEGDKVLIKFAQRDCGLAITQDWFRKKVNELRQSPHEHDQKKARAIARICAGKLRA